MGAGNGLMITIHNSVSLDTYIARKDGVYICHVEKHQINDMKAWIDDCEWREREEDFEFDVWKLSDLVVIRGIESHFGGGLIGFIESY
jgi:hypothetical protein